MRAVATPLPVLPQPVADCPEFGAGQPGQAAWPSQAVQVVESGGSLPARLEEREKVQPLLEQVLGSPAGFPVLARESWWAAR